MVEGFMQLELREQKAKLQEFAQREGVSPSYLVRKLIQLLEADATFVLNQPVRGKKP